MACCVDKSLGYCNEEGNRIIPWNTAQIASCGRIFSLICLKREDATPRSLFIRFSPSLYQDWGQGEK